MRAPPRTAPINPAADGRQLNEVDFDLDVVGQSISGLNFTVARSGRATGQATSLGSSSVSIASAGTTAHALSLSSSDPNGGLQAQAATQGFQPVAGCNCPLCRMLRDATWTQVTNVAATTGADPAGTSAAGKP